MLTLITVCFLVAGLGFIGYGALLYAMPIPPID